jgi:hypothetical protein
MIKKLENKLSTACTELLLMAPLSFLRFHAFSSYFSFLCFHHCLAVHFLKYSIQVGQLYIYTIVFVIW